MCIHSQLGQRVRPGAGKVDIAVEVVIDIADDDADEVPLGRKAGIRRELEAAAAIHEDERRAVADEQKIRCAVSVHIAEREPATERRQDVLSYPRQVVRRRVDAIG